VARDQVKGDSASRNAKEFEPDVGGREAVADRRG
jgi:hypothetical protein